MASNILSYITSFLVIAGTFVALDFLIFFLVKKKTNWLAILTVSFIYFAVLLVGASYVNKAQTGKSIVTDMSSELSSAADATVAQYVKTGVSQEDAAGVRSAIQTFIIRPLWGWMSVSIFLFSLLNYLFVREIAIRRFHIDAPMLPFRYWYGGEPAIWAFIACIAVVLLKSRIKSDLAVTIALNAGVVLLNFYALVGGAVVWYFASQMKVPKFLSNAALIIAVLLILFANIFVVILFYSSIIILVPLGIFDTWFNFRRMARGGAIWK